MSRTIAITGALGTLGGKLRAHFAGADHVLRLLDAAETDDPAVTRADISVWNEDWVRQFEGADTVVHLAAASKPGSDWTAIQRANIDLTLNVYEAAARNGVRRLIFASSNWVMAGYRHHDVHLTTDMEPRPVNPYGVSKLVGERLGRSYFERRGLEVVCFRIGYIQPGDNRPGPHMLDGAWGQMMWLSNRDFCQAVEAAMLASRTGFLVLNLMSDNPGMPWDIEATKAAIGYAPLDGHAAVVDEEMRRRGESARMARALQEQLAAFELAQRW